MLLLLIAAVNAEGFGMLKVIYCIPNSVSIHLKNFTVGFLICVT